MLIQFRLSVAVILLLGLITSCKDSAVLPQSWRSAWESPSVSYRPLQIVHGADIRNKASYYKDTCGLGGVVCNVPFGENYLKSESEWKTFVDGVEDMRKNGLRVWIYDEDGYPSLGAGGHVLEDDPSLEALEMVYDKDSKTPFVVRPCYEYAHASNNFYMARRYPNPLNPMATQKFIELTHQAYYDHLGPELYRQVEAFFTDEPSMMAVNLGELREDVRKNVKVIDPIDTKKKNLPMVSWVNDLPEKYKTRYGEELMPVVASLFSGADEKDKVVRQKFWTLLAELNRDYYYEAIQSWCKSTREKNDGHGPLASGHGLREENPSNHVSLDGNKLLVSSGFDIPGLDQLSSDPSIWEDSSWMAAFFPGSSATLNGQRRVMCEMSDFDQTINGKSPVDVQHMQASAAWQMAFGVTDFTLYYTIAYGDKYPNRNESAYREYCNFVGRINSILMDASPVRKTLLYYPIYDLQREYIPTADKMSWRTQSELTKTIETSFRQLGANLLKAQTQFVLVDYLVLEKAKVNSNGTIQVGANQYSSIVFPKGITLPASVSKVMEEAKSQGVKIVYSDDYNESPLPEQLAQLVGAEEKLIPVGESVAFGKFTRDGLDIYIMTNTGDQSYTGKLNVQKGKRYVKFDPQTGQLSEEQKIVDQSVSVNLAPLQTRLFVVL
ncbi:MAG: hypothetical protein JZU47_12780 [Prolixibacteraceae bacterium]|nr:hypothetical protein [Prolixibacteraceae bacterium]